MRVNVHHYKCKILSIGQSIPHMAIFLDIFKMATVCHFGFVMSMFAQPTKSIFVGIDAVHHEP